MAIPFSVYQKVLTIVSKGMKIVGDHFVPIVIVTVAGALAITGKLTYDKIEKENTKYKYKEWIIYRQGEFVYATRGKESIVKKADEFEELQKMIDSAD